MSLCAGRTSIPCRPQSGRGSSSLATRKTLRTSSCGPLSATSSATAMRSTSGPQAQTHPRQRSVLPTKGNIRHQRKTPSACSRPLQHLRRHSTLRLGPCCISTLIYLRPRYASAPIALRSVVFVVRNWIAQKEKGMLCEIFWERIFSNLFLSERSQMSHREILTEIST